VKFRFRFLAALMALALFQVEGLWASSMCMAEMEMPAASQMADADPQSEAYQPGHPHEQDRTGSKAPACPLMPGGVASCEAGIALLPFSVAPDLGPTEGERAGGFTDHAKDLLLAVYLLRPPKA
jgi:hypothetical protein